MDYNGQSFTIAAADLSLGFEIDKYNVISHDEQSGDVISNAIVNMTRSVEEELGVTLEFYDLGGNTARNNVDTLTKLIYASEDVIQVAMPISVALAKLLATPDMLTDLNDIDTLDLSHSWWDKNSVEEFTIGDKLYSVTGEMCLYQKGAPIVLFFNKELAEKLKLEDPYQLVYDGEWTLDKMIEMANAAAMDNGNQTVDKEDTFGLICEGLTMSHLMTSCGVDFSARNSDGSVEMTVYNEKTIDIMEKVIPLMRDRTVSMYAPDWQNAAADVWGEILTPAFTNGNALFLSNQLLMALDFRAMEADFGILPLPKYDTEQENYISVASDWWGDNIVVPTTNQDLELTGYVLEAMGYYSQQLITPAFIDTSVYGKSIRDDDSAKMIEIVLDNQYYDVSLLFDWGELAINIRRMVDKSSTDFASTYDSIKAQIEDAKEKTMSEFLDN